MPVFVPFTGAALLLLPRHMRSIGLTRRHALAVAGALALLLAQGCGESEPTVGEPSLHAPGVRPIGRTLGRAIERGALRVLILPRSERYLPRDGKSTLHERDLVEDFAADLGLAVQYVDVGALAELVPALLDDRGDLIASNFTNTAERSRQIVFSSPVEVVREQVVTRSQDDRLERRSDLQGRRLAVLRGSAHFQTAVELAQKAPGIEIETAPAGAVTEDLLQGLETRKYDVALVDSNLMNAAQRWHPDLRIAFDVGEPRMIAWAMRPHDTELRRAADSFLARTHHSAARRANFEDDLPAIRERGRLRVLTRNAATSYFVWRGELVGFEYDLAKHFADELGLRIEVVVPPRNEDLVPWLRAGKGDLIAAGLTATEAREARDGVRFSRKYLEVSEKVVTRADDTALQSPADLEGRSFVVRKSSAYWNTLTALRDSGLPIEIVAAPEEYETEEIIARVASGEYDLTLADKHIIEVEQAMRDDVRAAFSLSENRALGWAVRPDSPELLAAIDDFFDREYKGLFYNLTARKYFGSDRALRALVGGPAHRSGQISPWDDIVRTYAARYGFDWRLVVAQMHQESRFDPEAESFAGARGLLQVMPRTARQLGFENLHDPDTGIHAGIRYLSWVRDRFEATLPQGERTWFALAAYNAGAGHVRDARKLATEHGYDPNRWFENVEVAMLMKLEPDVHPGTRFGYCNGAQTVRYVRAISARYDAYVQIVENASPGLPVALAVQDAKPVKLAARP